MGPLLARLGHAIVALPGGCAIGTRPIEQHIKGFEALGADIHLENGNIYANAKDGLKGAYSFRFSECRCNSKYYYGSVLGIRKIYH